MITNYIVCVYAHHVAYNVAYIWPTYYIILLYNIVHCAWYFSGCVWCVCVGVSVCVRACVRVACMRACVHVCVSAFISACVRTCVRAGVRTCARVGRCCADLSAQSGERYENKTRHKRITKAQPACLTKRN